MLPRGIGHRLPVQRIVGIAALQAELSQHINTDRGLLTLDRLRRGRLLYTNNLSLHIGRKVLSYIGTSCTPLDRLVSIPIWPMPRPLTTLAATGLPAVANLLVIGNLAIHGAPLAKPPYNRLDSLSIGSIYLTYSILRE